jgi:hypothetical protein
MLAAIEGVYADGKVVLQETPHGIERARVIVTFLLDGSEKAPGGPGVDLYGVWKDRVPVNADIDELLQDICRECSLSLPAPLTAAPETGAQGPAG